MAWITSLLRKPETIAEEPATLDEAGAPARPEEPAAPPSGAQLAVLAPDVAGISSFRLRMFPDSGSALAYLAEMHPEMRRGTHAFWALHDEPIAAPDSHREALVLIRANLTSDVVYVVSFLDLESAWSFARFEAKRGLDLSHLIVLWASFAVIREEFDGVSVLPPQAPATVNQRAATLEPPPARIRRPAPEIVPEAAAPIADSVETLDAPTRPAVDDEAQSRRRAETAHIEAAAAARQAAAALAQAEAARVAAEAALVEAEAEAEAEAGRRERATRLAEEAHRRVLAERRAAAETAAREALVALPPQPVIEAGPETAPPPPAPTSLPGDEEWLDDDTPTGDDAEPRGTIFMHRGEAQVQDTVIADVPQHLRRKAAPSGDPADEFPKEPELDAFDIAYEVERLLSHRRWDKRAEPFNGFKSPPGRF